jgi:3-methyladenine DNA glycosylase/8-oxoguanine DNA glycosylase
VARRLCRLEPRFRALRTAHGSPPWRRTRNSFRSLARAIVYQQVAGAAAAAVFRRFRSLYPGAAFPTPAQVDATSFEALRGAGLSRQKATYLGDLASAYLDGRIRPRDFDRCSDDEIVEMLTAVRGIGPWTAEIFLMFDLLRPDVLPLGDYGIQQGFKLLYDLGELPDPATMRELAEPWRPHRSQACWYLWRLLEDSRK